MNVKGNIFKLISRQILTECNATALKQGRGGRKHKSTIQEWWKIFQTAHLKVYMVKAQLHKTKIKISQVSKIKISQVLWHVYEGQNKHGLGPCSYIQEDKTSPLPFSQAGGTSVQKAFFFNFFPEDANTETMLDSRNCPHQPASHHSSSSKKREAHRKKKLFHIKQYF